MPKLVAYLSDFKFILIIIILLPVTKMVHVSKTTLASFEEKARTDAFQLTDPRDNPYAVLVIGEQDFSIIALCSGTLLSSYWVLTAGHCVASNGSTFKSFIIYAGGRSWQEITIPQAPLPTGSQIRGIFKVFQLSEGDLALMLVRSSFRITEYVKPIKISITPWQHNDVLNCKATGFGEVQIGESSPKLDFVRKTQVFQTVTPCKCHDEFLWEISSKDRKYFSCSLPKQDFGMCQGDSGAGLICNNRLQGVASLIAQAKNIDNCDFSLGFEQNDVICGDKNTVSVFTLIYPHVQWLNSTLDRLCKYEILPNCRDGAKNTTESPHIINIIILFLLTNGFLALQ